MSPTRAPLRVRSAFVPIVELCVRWYGSPVERDLRPSIPRTTACCDLDGVEKTFPISTDPSEPRQTRSVNVPPISTPSRCTLALRGSPCQAVRPERSQDAQAPGIIAERPRSGPRHSPSDKRNVDRCSAVRTGAGRCLA